MEASFSGEELDNKTDASYLNFDEITCQSHSFGQALIMRPCQKIKGEWSYVYTTPVDGEDYALINNYSRFSQSGLLELTACKERGAG